MPVESRQMPDRTPFIAGNWKMNLSKDSGRALAKLVAGAADGKVQVGCGVPFVYLDAVREAVGNDSPLLIGAQDCHHEAVGAFTGEISVDMLKDVGTDFVIVGHSERRHVLGEGSDLLSKKAKAVLDGGLILVHCVGETLEEREADKTFDVIDAQLNELTEAPADPAKLVIAYEPVWAIGTGKTATPDQAQDVHKHIRTRLAEKFGQDAADQIRIQYGGSVKADNAADLLGQPDIDGALVGGASLKAESFLPIVEAARSA